MQIQFAGEAAISQSVQFSNMFVCPRQGAGLASGVAPLAHHLQNSSHSHSGGTGQRHIVITDILHLISLSVRTLALRPAAPRQQLRL